MQMTSCTVSSSFVGYYCTKTYDGVVGVDRPYEWASNSNGQGTWIRLDVDQPMYLRIATLWFRCHNADQFRRVVFEVVGGETIQVFFSGI